MFIARSEASFVSVSVTNLFSARKLRHKNAIGGASSYAAETANYCVHKLNRIDIEPMGLRQYAPRSKTSLIPFDLNILLQTDVL